MRLICVFSVLFQSFVIKLKQDPDVSGPIQFINNLI
jgi:hypothetical protein